MVLYSLLNFICITVPEFIFLVIITFRMMGRKEMLDLYNIKNNLVSIMKIVIPSAILLDLLNYIHITPVPINKLLSYTCIYIFIIYILNLEEHSYIEYPKLKQKAFIYLFLGIFISIIIETITLPLIFELTNKTYDEIKLNIFLIIICSMSARIIDLIILIYIFIKKNSKFQIDVFNYIFSNKFFMKLTIFATVGLIIFEVYFIKLLTTNNLLNIVGSIYEQFLIVVGFTFLLPSLLIVMVYTCINYCAMVINSDKQTYHE